MKKYLVHIIFSLLVGLPQWSSAGSGGPKPPKDDFIITITTDSGTIKILLYDQTPNHKAKFKELVEGNYFRSSNFFKAVDNFFIQGGDVNSQEGVLREEPGMPHKKGALGAMATIDPTTEVKTSQITQFYIVTNPEGVNFLNKNYTIFGEVIEGMDVVEKIANMPKDENFDLTLPLKITVTGETLKRKKITKLTGYQYPAPDAK